MFCSKCGNQITNEDANFCPRCGATITKQATVQKPIENRDVVNMTGIQARQSNQTDKISARGLNVVLIGLIGAVSVYFIQAVLYGIRSYLWRSTSYAFFHDTVNRFLNYGALLFLIVVAIGQVMAFFQQRKRTNLVSAISVGLYALLGTVSMITYTRMLAFMQENTSLIAGIQKWQSAFYIIMMLIFAVYPLMLLLKRKKQPILNVLLLCAFAWLSVVHIFARILFYRMFNSFLRTSLEDILFAGCVLVCLLCVASELKSLKMPLHLKSIIPVILSLVILLMAIIAVRCLVIPSLASSQPSQTGDIIEFGSYEQDNDIGNGSEPIEWIVLARENGKMLVVSKYCLDCQPYNIDNGQILWESSTLRDWLNEDFMEAAFTDSEKNRICQVTVKNPGIYAGMSENGSWIVTNTEENVKTVLYQTPGGNQTENFIFLLNVDEIDQYFASDEAKIAYMTEYAREKFICAGIEEAAASGIKDEEIVKKRYQQLEDEYGNGFCYWWLISTGYFENTSSVIHYCSAEIQPTYVEQKAGVRPAMWIYDNR